MRNKARELAERYGFKHKKPERKEKLKDCLHCKEEPKIKNTGESFIVQCDICKVEIEAIRESDARRKWNEYKFS